MFTPTIDYSQPVANQIEVTVLGGGVGESIVLHLGRSRWVIVDSYLTSDNAEPAALRYLRDIDVSPDDVVAIVTTHWDDDHIGGMAALVKTCRLASFHCPGAMLADEFRVLVYMWHPLPDEKAPSRIAEIAAILHTLEDVEDGARGPREIMSGSRITTAPGYELPIRVVAPHSAAVRGARQQFLAAQAIEIASRSTVVVRDRNLGSAVLWLDSADRRALLAGDLMNSKQSALLGWGPVIAALSNDRRAQLYKVAHHGSHKSHHYPVWTNLLLKEPHAAVTAYTAHIEPLPTATSRRVIGALTHRGWLAGESRRQRMIFMRGQDAAAADRTGRPQRRAGAPGIMRFRADPDASTVANWKVAVDGNVRGIWRAGGS